MVEQRVIELCTGISALRELDIHGAQVHLGLVDAQVCDPVHGSVVDETIVIRPRRKKFPGTRTHADQMLDVIRHAAPETRVISVEVAEDDGLIFRPSIAAGLEALTNRNVDIVLLSIEIRRPPDRCTPEHPCVACTATNTMASSAIVVVAAGNTGTEGFTCPAAAASDAIVILATNGPPDAVEQSGGGVSGTSVSAAFTAGGIALLRSALPGLETQEVEDALRATSARLTDPHVTRAHFFRAYRYLAHIRSGAYADQNRAQSIVDENHATLESARVGKTPPSTGLNIIDSALEYAPWSAGLHGAKANLLIRDAPLQALHHLAESIRLDWEDAWLHKLLAQLLDSLGLPGASVEREVARNLERGETSRAVRELDLGLAQSQVQP